MNDRVLELRFRASALRCRFGDLVGLVRDLEIVVDVWV